MVVGDIAVRSVRLPDERRPTSRPTSADRRLADGGHVRVPSAASYQRLSRRERSGRSDDECTDVSCRHPSTAVCTMLHVGTPEAGKSAIAYLISVLLPERRGPRSMYRPPGDRPLRHPAGRNGSGKRRSGRISSRSPVTSIRNTGCEYRDGRRHQRSLGQPLGVLRHAHPRTISHRGAVW